MLDRLERRLKQLEMRCRRRVDHLLYGSYRSVFKGRGVEFEELSAYRPGDDVRKMDWRVTLRTGEAHIKRFVEEREHFVYLIVDVSNSMTHENNDRVRDAVTEVCALLTLSAQKNQDRVGLFLFTDQIEYAMPPDKGRGHTIRILDKLMRFEPKGKGTDLAETLRCFGQVAKRRSIVFVVSDFLATGYASELQALAFRHDVNAIRISSRQMEDSSFTGLARIRDAESGLREVIELKQERDSDSLETLRLAMLDMGVDLLDIPVGTDCADALAHFFDLRQRKPSFLGAGK
ncbi:MAG: DUF58 domain-containing protein [Verrucomicrobiota bacterium]